MVVDKLKNLRSYLDKIENQGRILRRNVIHIRKRKSLLFEDNIITHKKKRIMQLLKSLQLQSLKERLNNQLYRILLILN